VYAEGAIMGMVLRDTFCSTAIVCSSLLFWLPIVREFAMLAGAIHADAQSIIKSLDAGKSLILLPEGMRGSLHVETPLDVLTGAASVGCNARTGWIRCAASSVNRERIRIVPVYIQGTADMYLRWNNNRTWTWLQQLLLHYIHYPWPMVHAGAYGTFWPRSVPLRVICGVPMAFSAAASASAVEDDITQMHKGYCDAIRDLMKPCE
jgi:1-acyl-sn-glycerol-3-phosphate acyltransferase